MRSYYHFILRHKAGLVLAILLALVLGGFLAVGSFALSWSRQAAPTHVPAPAVQPQPQAQVTASGPVPDAAPGAAYTAVPNPAGVAGGPAEPSGTELPAAPQDSASAADSGAAAGSAEPAAAISQRVTVLLLGVDSRPTEGAGRSDTMVVLSFDPQTGATGMISLARDLLVQVPGIKGLAKINTANFYGDANKYPGGGPELARKTVENFLGYPVDYWVRVDFDGFRKIVDQIGGIDIQVPKAINDPLYPNDTYGYDPLYIPAGNIHMDGSLALKYARTRHQDNDYDRARRQQQVIKAVEDKLMQPRVLAGLLPRLPALALTLSRSVQTNMPVDKAAELARTISEAGRGETRSVVVDDTMGYDSTDPVWGFVLIPNLRKVRAAAATVLADTPPAKAAAAGADPAIALENARILVLNGTREKQLATSVASELTAEGYNVVHTGPADQLTYAQSWLIIRGDAPATAAALARRFGISPDRIESQPADSTNDLLVVLGADAVESRAALP